MTNRHFGFPLTFFQRAVTRCHQGARASMKGNTPDTPSFYLNQYPGTKRVCGGQTDAADTPRKCSDHTTSSALWIPAQRVSPRWPTWKHLSEQATQPLTMCVGSAWRPDRPRLPPSEHEGQSVGHVSDPARDNAHYHGAWRALP